MSKVSRLDTLNHAIGNYEYSLPVTPDSEYVVDDSSFVPMKEAIKQLSTVGSSIDSLRPYYDFQDGKDTGIEIPINRTKDGKDIAEISSHIMEKVGEITEDIENQKRSIKQKEEFNAKLESIKQSGSTPPAE